MSKKIPMIIGLVWLLAATALYGYAVWNGQPDGVYTYDNDGCTQDQTVYVADNETKEGLIYEMDLYGKVTDFFSTKELQDEAFIRKVAAYDGALYAVMAIPDAAGQEDTYTYQILKFSDGLQLTAMTAELSIYETDVLTDLVVDGTGMYLATVARDGSAACVYGLSDEQMLDPETAAQSAVTVESFLRQEAETGRTYVAASYEMGGISVRSDADLVSGPFAVDDTVRYTYSLCHMNLGQLMSLHGSYRIYWLIGVLAGWLVVLLLYVLLRNRNRIVYLASVLELILLIVVMGGSGIFIYKQMQTQQTARTKWIASVLNEVLTDIGNPSELSFTDSGFYTSEQYTQLRDRLQTAYTQTREDGCEDLFFADTTDLCVYCSDV